MGREETEQRVAQQMLLEEKTEEKKRSIGKRKRRAW
jgi:hypothetical protein